VLDGNPAVGPSVVSLDDVGRTAAAPAADDEHDLVRDARPSDRVGEVDVLDLFHVEVVEELDRLDDDRLALLVVVHQRVFLSQFSLVSDIAIFVLKRDVKLQLTNSCHSLANWDSCPTPAKSEATEVGVTGWACSLHGKQT